MAIKSGIVHHFLPLRHVGEAATVIIDGRRGRGQTDPPHGRAAGNKKEFLKRVALWPRGDLSGYSPSVARRALFSRKCHATFAGR